MDSLRGWGLRLSSVRPLLLIALCVMCGSSGFGADDASATREASERGFLERWDEWNGDERQFPLWTPQWKDEDLKARFEQMNRERHDLYFTTEGGEHEGHRRDRFQVPENRKQCGFHDVPHLSGALGYNLASPSYNASIISINGKQFLAMGAPTEETRKAFFILLSDYGVTDLVRLTPATEGGHEGAFPYWDGRINVSPENARPTLCFSGREIRYFFTDRWVDQQSFDTDRLVALVKAVMAHDGPTQLIGVHCHAGIGRTGTFLAAYELIREIDQQRSRGVNIDKIQVSVDKVIWELSFQRLFAVGTFSQYESLYRVVGLYLQKLGEKDVHSP